MSLLDSVFTNNNSSKMQNFGEAFYSSLSDSLSKSPPISTGKAISLFGNSNSMKMQNFGEAVYNAYRSAKDSLASSAPTAQAVSQAPSVSSGAVVTRGDGGVSVAMPDYLYADLAKAYGMDATTAYQEALSNTSYRRAMADLKAAGLNPILAATGLSGASGVSYAQPLAQSGTVASYSGNGLSTGNSSAKSTHFWYKRLTNIGTIIGAVKGHPIIGATVGGSIGNLLDSYFD